MTLDVDLLCSTPYTVIQDDQRESAVHVTVQSARRKHY